MNPLKKSRLKSHLSASWLTPALLLLPALLSGCEVALLNGQDPSQLSSNRLIGSPPAASAHFGDAYYPYHPGYAYHPGDAYRPDYPMGLLKPQYPYRPDYPRAAYTPPQDWSNPYYPYYPAHHPGPDEAGPNFPYYPYYPSQDASGLPVPGSAFCLPGYEAHLYGNGGGSRPSYLCIPRADAGYAYYPG